MEPYEPKRIDGHKFDGYNRSIGIAITREQWSSEKGWFHDYYLYINLWWWNVTLVFLRFDQIKKNDKKNFN